MRGDGGTHLIHLYIHVMERWTNAVMVRWLNSVISADVHRFLKREGKVDSRLCPNGGTTCENALHREWSAVLHSVEDKSFIRTSIDEIFCSSINFQIIAYYGCSRANLECVMLA